MAYIQLTPTMKTTRNTSILTAIGASGVIRIYTGTPPTDPSVTATGTLLVTLPCSSTFGVVAGTPATLTANAITAANAVATGTAGYARIETSAFAGVVDLDVTATGGGGSVQLATTSITTGLSVSLTSLTIAEQ